MARIVEANAIYTNLDLEPMFAYSYSSTFEVNNKPILDWLLHDIVVYGQIRFYETWQGINQQNIN